MEVVTVHVRDYQARYIEQTESLDPSGLFREALDAEIPNDQIPELFRPDDSDDGFGFNVHHHE